MLAPRAGTIGVRRDGRNPVRKWSERERLGSAQTSLPRSKALNRPQLIRSALKGLVVQRGCGDGEGSL